MLFFIIIDEFEGDASANGEEDEDEFEGDEDEFEGDVSANGEDDDQDEDGDEEDEFVGDASANGEGDEDVFFEEDEGDVLHLLRKEVGAFVKREKELYGLIWRTVDGIIPINSVSYDWIETKSGVAPLIPDSASSLEKSLNSTMRATLSSLPQRDPSRQPWRQPWRLGQSFGGRRRGSGEAKYEHKFAKYFDTLHAFSYRYASTGW